MTDEEAWKQVIKFDRLIKWTLFVKYGKHLVMSTGLDAADVVQECRINVFKAVQKKGVTVVITILVSNSIKWRLFRLLEKEKTRKRIRKEYCTKVDKLEYYDENDKLVQEEFNKDIYKLLGMLPYRERMIVQLRFGIRYKQEHTLKEVGKIFGITKERVRQIERKALRRLKSYLREVI